MSGHNFRISVTIASKQFQHAPRRPHIQEVTRHRGLPHEVAPFPKKAHNATRRLETPIINFADLEFIGSQYDPWSRFCGGSMFIWCHKRPHPYRLERVADNNAHWVGTFRGVDSRDGAEQNPDDLSSVIFPLVPPALFLRKNGG